MLKSFRVAAGALLFSAAVLAQTPANTANLGIRFSLPDSVVDVADGGTINMPVSALGQTLTAGFTVTNRGTTLPQINFAQMSGSTDFTLFGVQEGPFALNPGASFGGQVTYKATTSQRTTARMQLNYTVGNATVNVFINFVGTAPEFTYSVIPQGGNATPLTDGATIAFPNTAVDAVANAVVVVTNRGTYQGTFNTATVTGESFQSIGVPLPGTIVDAGRDVRFTVQYAPKTLADARGALSVETADKRVAFNLTGSSTGAQFTYELVGPNGAATPLRPNSMINLPDIAVGEKSSVVVRFRNTGNAEGRIALISSAPPTLFTLTEVPLLPLVVPAGSAFNFTVNFNPTTPGRQLGRLRIGGDDFELAGNGLGAQLTYSYVANNVSTTVASAGSVIFTPAAVGGSSNLRFVITNTGTSPATVSSIGLATATTIFTLGALPALPSTLQPNASIGFPVTFAPNALGTSTGTLRIDTATFTLSGAGNAPPPLPAIRFDGATGAQEPLQQPAIGLTLAENYPLALTGTLTLTFNSEVFSNDPAVQFATGGRAVNFTIPAGSNRAIFSNNANQIRVQTGSVAGSIVLTPAISTLDGGIVLTPSLPPTATLTVAQGAPRILSVTLSAKTANTITLLISGYATSRQVTQGVLNFTPVSGETVTTTSLTLPLDSSFIGWFNSAQSAQFGGLFTVSIPLTLAGDVKNVTQISDTIQSVSATLSNSRGTSNSVSLTLR